MSGRTFGFGIIGAGVIAPTHCKAIQALPNARITSVCDLELPKARALAMRFGIAHACEDPRDLLARDDVDVVNVLAWSGVHAELGMQAARAGKHVICTKPIDVRLEQIDRLIASCRSQGVRLGVTHQFRSYPAYARARQAVESGRLGRLFLGTASLRWNRSQDYYDSAAWRGTWSMDGGGALMNQGIHYVDLLQWLMGPVASVTASTATLNHRIEVEDCATASLRFESGALGTLEAATCMHEGIGVRVEVYGERGSILLEDDRIRLWEVEGDPREAAEGPADPGAAARPEAGLDRGVEAHVAQIGDVLAAVEEGRDPILSGEEGRKAVEIVLAVYRSAQRGAAVTLPLRTELSPPLGL